MIKGSLTVDGGRNMDVKHAIGQAVTGVYTYQLHINEKLELVANEFIISVRGAERTVYWHVEWLENEAGYNMLCIREQLTPEPLRYTMEPLVSNEYIILDSYFRFDDQIIEQITGYGEHDVLELFVLTFSESYITIRAAPAIEITYTKDEPIIQKNCLFTY